MKAKNNFFSKLIRGYGAFIALVALLGPGLSSAAAITADFSGTATNTGGSQSFVSFPGTTLTGPADVTDIDTGLIGSAELAADVQAIGTDSLQFGQETVGAGEHTIVAQSDISAIFQNLTGAPVFGVLEFNILPGFISITDFVSTFNGSIPSGATAGFEFTVSINGVDVVVASASVEVPEGGLAAGSININQDANLLAGQSTQNARTGGTATKGEGEVSFSWNQTTGIIDLGTLEIGETVTADFMLRSSSTGTSNCGEYFCPISSVFFNDPPGLGTMAYSLRSAPSPTFPPFSFPADIFAAVVTGVPGQGGTQVTQPPIHPDNFTLEPWVDNPIPVPGTLALFALGLLGAGAARRRKA